MTTCHSPMRSEGLEAALEYLDAGMVPIRIKPGTKAPLHGQDYQRLRPTRADVARWWGQHPDAGCALLLEPSMLIVVDADCAEAVTAVEAMGTDGAPSCETGAGRHYFFRRPPGCPARRAIKVHRERGWLWRGKGVDILGRGYAVVHPSIHPSGRLYGPWSPADLVDAPEWVVDALQPPRRPEVSSAADYGDVSLALVEDALKSVPASCERMEWLTVGAAICDANAGEAGFAVFDRWSSACAEKYNPRETPRQWRTFQGASVTVGALFYIARTYGWTPPPGVILVPPPPVRDLCRESEPDDDWVMPEPPPLPPDAWDGLLEASEEGVGEGVDGGAGGAVTGAEGQWPPEGPLEWSSHVYVARLVAESMAPAGELVSDEGHLWRWSGSCWRRQGGSVARQRVHALDRVPVIAGRTPEGDLKTRPLNVSRSFIMGVVGELMHLSGVSSEGFFAEAPSGVQFADAFVTLDSAGELAAEPAVPALRQRQAYDFDVPVFRDWRLIAPTWERALYSWTSPTDAERERYEAALKRSAAESLVDPEEDAHHKALLLQEFAGACLLGIATRYRRALVLLGEGRNGKSKFIEALQAAFPRGSWCTVDPQDFEDEYRAALLAGMRLNVAADIPSREIAGSSVFKAVVSGDIITARPIRQDPFQFRPVAGHLFSANELPSTRDHSGGFWSRFIVVGFEQHYGPDDADPELSDKFAAEQRGIVAWACEGATRLARQGKYTVPASSAALLSHWRREADVVALWLQERCRTGAEADETRATLLWEDYKAWSKDNGYSRMGSRTFYGRLKRLIGAPRHSRQGNVYPASLIEPWQVSGASA